MTLFEDFVDSSGWTEADGPEVGIFGNKPPGGACLWTCRWSTSQGLIEPENITPKPPRSRIAILYEVHDIAFLALAVENGELSNASKAVYWQAVDNIDGMEWYNSARSVISKWRLRPAEYVWPYAPLAPPTSGYGKIMVPRYRPGWLPLEVEEGEE